MKIDAPNLNHCWAQLLVEELVRLGVDRFFIAPGSRSTPLSIAAVAHPQVKATIHFDERGLAFAALGCARVTRRPAAVITTSGTAVANLLPAVVEASLENVPLLLLTADRPPELRDCGANQAIDQVKIFGDHVRWHFDMPCPDEKVSPRVVLSTVDHAHARAMTGPVHLNLQFREPLAPSIEPYDRKKIMAHLGNWLAAKKPFTRYQDPEVMTTHGWLTEEILPRRRVKGVVVLAGPVAASPHFENAIVELAEAAGWPLITDVRSEHRGHGICFADHLLLSDRFARSMRPDVVLQFGARLVSKRVQQWIEASKPSMHAIVSAGFERLDPGLSVTHRWSADPGFAARALLPRIRGSGRATWLRAWRRADAAAAKSISTELDCHPLSEPWIARATWDAAANAGHGIVLASSMPVRDVDMLAGSTGASFVVANRGASGIDGTVSTAIGAALGSDKPVTLLIGDLSLLHDLNTLALLRDHRKPFVIVAVNNDGGGIFHFLPVAAHPQHFEKVFGTPHGLGFAAAAEMFRLRYVQPQSTEAFTAAYREASAHDGPTLIEVRTQRDENLRIHRAIQTGVRAAVERLLR